MPETESEVLAKPFLMIAETIDKQTVLLEAVCAVLVAKGVCAADELAEAIVAAKKQRQSP